MLILRILLPLFVVLCSYLNGALGRGECKLLSSCTCRYDNGEYIDLSPLDGAGGVPTFLNVSDGGVDSFSWNPCTWFTEGPCVNVSVCQMRHKDDDVEFFTIGWQQTAQFTFKQSTGEQILTYNAITNETDIRFAIFTLTCVQNNRTSLEAFGQESPPASHLYKFELKSPYACPQGGPPTTEPTQTTTNSATLQTIEVMVIAVLSCMLVLIVLLILVLLKLTGKVGKRTSYERMK